MMTAIPCTKNLVFKSLYFDLTLTNGADHDEMPHVGHFIWVFTVCQMMGLGVSAH